MKRVCFEDLSETLLKDKEAREDVLKKLVTQHCCQTLDGVRTADAARRSKETFLDDALDAIENSPPDALRFTTAIWMALAARAIQQERTQNETLV